MSTRHFQATRHFTINLDHVFDAGPAPAQIELTPQQEIERLQAEIRNFSSCRALVADARNRIAMLEEEMRAQEIAAPLVEELLANVRALDVAYSQQDIRRKWFVAKAKEMGVAK